jgi:hypothetical protein
MVIHLQSVKHITAAGLGALLGIRRQVLDAGLTLSLSGLSLWQRFLLHSWCAQPLFDEWALTIAQGRARAKEMEPVTSIGPHREQEVLVVETRARG